MEQYLREIYADRFRASNQALCFNYSTSPNWDFAQASAVPDTNWMLV